MTSTGSNASRFFTVFGIDLLFWPDIVSVSGRWLLLKASAGRARDVGGPLTLFRRSAKYSLYSARI